MKHYRYIAALTLIVVGVGLTLSVRADDYVDDVYYWDTPQYVPQESVRVVYTEETADGMEMEEDHTGNRPYEITFIEEDNTQRTDTMVKAVIRRL